MNDRQLARNLGSSSGGVDDPAEGFYVIIGRGVSAWYNHLTLVHPENPWGHRRLSNVAGPGPDYMRVMHIGYPDPWSRRQCERMGQWPRMLDFFDGIVAGLGLGDRVQPAEKQKDWLRADLFAAALQEVEQYVAETFYAQITRDDGLTVTGRGKRSGLVLKAGFAGLIESRDESQGKWLPVTFEPQDSYLPAPELKRWRNARRPLRAGAAWLNPACPYRISVYHEGELSYVYAYKIDVCTGPGQPRLIVDEPRAWNTTFATEELYREHLPQFDRFPVHRSCDDGLPRIVNGNAYVGSTNDPTKSVIIYGMNPVGAQCVQSALAMPEGDRASSVARVWFVAQFDAKTFDPGAPNDEPGAVVPGHRNLLELVGNSEIFQNVYDLIEANHVPHPVLGSWGKDIRDIIFKNRLHLLAWHELQGISEYNGKLVCTFVQPEKHYLPTIKLPDDVPIRAEESLISMLDAIDLGWAAGSSAEGLVPGLTTKVEEGAFVVDSIAADLVVYSRGQEKDYRREGNAGYLTRMLGEMMPIYVLSTSKFPVAVSDKSQDQDVDDVGRVRVLGSAMFGLSALPSHIESVFHKLHLEHTRRLPGEGAGGGNLVVSINNIRRANHFVERQIRLNCASEEELVAAGISADGARQIVEIRSRADVVRGFTIAQFQEALMLAGYDEREEDVEKLGGNMDFRF